MRRIVPISFSVPTHDVRSVARAAPRVIKPPRWVLEGDRPALMTTSLGPLDALGALNDGRGFDDLLRHTLPLSGHEPVRFLDLPTLIEVKVAAGRPKDVLGVAVLRALCGRSDTIPHGVTST